MITYEVRLKPDPTYGGGQIAVSEHETGPIVTQLSPGIENMARPARLRSLCHVELRRARLACQPKLA